MLQLAGYEELDQLYSGNRTLVYRAIRKPEKQPVIIKILRNPHPDFQELVQFRHQYTITSQLEHPRIVKPLGLETRGNSYALVMPDDGAIALSDYWYRSPRSLEAFLALAIQLTEALGYLIQQHIIHKDIKPANILIHPETGEIKLIDFSISSILPKEHHHIINPNVLEGTLAYISPEQTGRMNRGIDYRTDFYSLGVTFFELLTGELPFKSDDAMELVHCHIAQGVRFPEDTNGEKIPTILQAIVLKLMAKNAENRYQSAWGLRYDLERCLEQLETTGKIEPFTLGERDQCDRFSIPETLYGREDQVQTLLDIFQRVADPHQEHKQAEMVLVAGFSGIGKTAVINEVHKPIVKQRGYFIKGKFDQFNRNIPLSAFVQAFQDLIGQLLGEPDLQLANWKNKILMALGDSAQVIIEVIPELEQIIGPQPAIAELSGNAAQNRFNLLFKNFVQVFTTPQHPLVIFLDDLQWADAASLNLLKLLMTEAEGGYLLILASYRDNEVHPTHPLLLTLGEIAQQGANLSPLTLTPLTPEDINHLVADTLRCSWELATPLSQLLYQKTQGNPFFATQFLKSLYEDGLITFNLESGHWECDLTAVRGLAITDDIVGFLVERLRKLPPSTQDILKLAACIGNQFDLNTLAVVHKQDRETVATSLWEALQEGFIVPENETYKFLAYVPQGEDQPESDPLAGQTVTYRFLHDRVQQAAYSLIPPRDKEITHLTIGRLLLQNTSQGEENLFQIVNQLNMGESLLESQPEREEVVQLNLRAAEKARASAAYSAAANYLHQAIVLLRRSSSHPWQDHYDLLFPLHSLLAEVSYLNGDFLTADEQIQIVLREGQSVLDTVKVYEIRIQCYVAQNQCQEALNVGLEVLNRLEIPLHDAPLPQIQVATLYHLPPLTNPRILAALRILSKLWAPAFIANPALLPQVILTLLNLSITHGNSSLGAFAYALYGMFLCATLTDLELGYRFGELALHTLDQYQDVELTCKVNQLFYAFIRNWKELVRDRVEALAQNVLTGLENGDLEFACYSAINYCDNLCLMGEFLPIIQQKQEYYIELTGSLHQTIQHSIAQLWGQFVDNLISPGENPTQLEGQKFQESQQIPALQAANAFSALFFFWTAKTILAYIFQDYQATLNHAATASQYQLAGGGLLPITQIPFYRALAQLALYPRLETDQKPQSFAQIEQDYAQLSQWVTHAPQNFQHKVNLIAAEQAKVLGQREQAMNLYDQAIAQAKEHQYLHEQALAYECAAYFYLDWGKDIIASAYLQKAYYCYAHWGAQAKIHQLEQNYSHLLTPILEKPDLTVTATNPRVSTQSFGTLTTTTTLFDLGSALKASQALSEEIELDALLGKLMHIVLENAGADQGVLVLNTLGQWEVVAHCQHNSCSLIHLTLDQVQILPQTLIHWVKRTARPILLNHCEQDNQFIGDLYFNQHHPKSLFCTPILNQGRLIGILYLENNLTAEVFTPRRLEMLNLLTAQAAISLENAQLYHNLEDKVTQRTAQLAAANAEISQLNERLRAENLRMGAELDVARRVQQMILPKPEELQAITPLEIAGYMAPADEVGGDYYDVLVEEDVITISIGDVTGHGLESGLVMLMAQTIVRTLRELGEQNPIRFLNTVNATIYKNVQRMGVDRTLSLAVLNYREGLLSISGQHELVLVVRANGHLEAIDTMNLGMTIGLVDDISSFVSQISLVLEPGDGIVLYTDGIPEAENQAGEFYGLDRFCDVIRRHWDKDASAIHQAVIDDLETFIASHKVFDDITLLVVKRREQDPT
ncbi:AAA family ATPase [Spirulina subsalsa FACHB-351]|uniref:AAA family ATPase n=1 Tax=Spirulina subsalsa FACHB-351 TaxID=234711 RepID=A0ABT3L197_9CYAN|nr:AAA family ATPase [Spirulina subsalsa]MCW6035251.1 AAA family ATPase [Spirulina subsalsa FACHB-351]